MQNSPFKAIDFGFWYNNDAMWLRQKSYKSFVFIHLYAVCYRKLFMIKWHKHLLNQTNEQSSPVCQLGENILIILGTSTDIDVDITSRPSNHTLTLFFPTKRWKGNATERGTYFAKQSKALSWIKNAAKTKVLKIMCFCGFYFRNSTETRWWYRSAHGWHM